MVVSLAFEISNAFRRVTCERLEYAVINASAISTTKLAAIAAWEVLQGFYAALPQLDADIKSREFNLWTESYGELKVSVAKFEGL